MGKKQKNYESISWHTLESLYLIPMGRFWLVNIIWLLVKKVKAVGCNLTIFLSSREKKYNPRVATLFCSKIS